MSRGKVLQIGYAAFVKAGIQTVIMNIARGVHQDFVIDVLLTSKREGYYDEEFLRYGRIYRVNCDVKGLGTLRRYCHYCIRPFKQFFFAYRLIKKNGYDIVHIHSGLEGGAMFLAAKAAGAKHIVAHSHNTASPEKRSIPSRVYRRVAKWLIHHCATLRVGVSEEANRFLYGEDAAILVNNPVELSRFFKARERAEKRAFSLVNVGRYSYQKNQSFLLEVSDALRGKGIEASLSLVGFGEDEEKLRAQIAELGLENRVKLIRGDGDADIPSLVAQSDFFIFPSRFEGLGIVLLEAQAAGCLCLASDAVPRTTDCGCCEYLPLSAGSVAWAEKLCEMALARECYCLDEAALARYEAGAVQREVLALYCDLLEK